MESTSFPDASAASEGSSPANCCGLHASTKVSAVPSKSFRLLAARAPVRAARAAAVPSPPSLQARSAAVQTLLANRPSTMADAMRPAPRKEIFGMIWTPEIRNRS